MMRKMIRNICNPWINYAYNNLVMEDCLLIMYKVGAD